jgi:hypothetical protein
MAVFTGSVRDLCAAFNRDPELLREKLSRVYINMGSLLETQGEWNEHLDPPAYIGVMRSGLPVYWGPCLPTKQNRSTHWTFKHREVLTNAPPRLQNWFIYALQTVDPGELDPMKAMEMDLRPWRHLVMKMDRNMWCTGGLIHAAGRKVYRRGDGWVPAVSAPKGAEEAPVFTYVPVRVEISERDGRAYTKWTEDNSNPNMHLYKVIDPENHEPAMKGCLRHLLRHFPVAAEPKGG